jgi:carbon monoxide dehydrogenase subunit G
MAERHVAATPAEVWAVLADGRRYADWVLGTQQIRSVDPEWPARDSSIHFVFGIGPLAYADRTTVVACVPHRVLELEVHAGYLGAMRVGVRLTPKRSGTCVLLEEHPSSGLLGRLHTRFGDVGFAVRAHLLLRELARLAEA